MVNPLGQCFVTDLLQLLGESLSLEFAISNFLVSGEHLRLKVKHRGQYIMIGIKCEGDHRWEGVASRKQGSRQDSKWDSKQRSEQGSGQGWGEQKIVSVGLGIDRVCVSYIDQEWNASCNLPMQEMLLRLMYSVMR